MILLRILVLLILLNVCCAETLMLTAKEQFVHSVSKTNLAVYFYGKQESQQYLAYQKILPSDKQLFSDLQFYFVPSNQIKISNRKQATLFIFRNIPGNQWMTYDGPMNTQMMSEWVRHNCFDALPEIRGEEIDDLFINSKKGFVLLDFGQFQLLGTKIILNDYCKENKLLCGKCTIKNPALGMVIQLMRAQNDPGIAKMAFWDPNTQKFTLFSKVPLPELTRAHLVEIVEGREGLVKPEVTPSPTEDLIDFVENNESDESEKSGNSEQTYQDLL